MWCALALLQLSLEVGGSFQSIWVTTGTTPRVAELLLDTTARGSVLPPEVQCEASSEFGVAELPCVLPINANISLLKRGAGETTGVDVSMDIFPGPKCNFVEEPDVYNRHFTCALCSPGDSAPCSGASDIYYQYPYRSAIVHNEEQELATMIRIIFPSGFDASQVEVDNNTMVLYNGSWTEQFGNQTVDRTGPYPVRLRRVRYAADGVSPPMSYGIAEPRPAARDFNRFPGMQTTSSRTGTVWALRDEWEDEEGAFDGKRVVDMITTDSIASDFKYDPLALYNETQQFSQRLALRLNGLVNRKATGFLGSASATDERIFAIQIYQVALQTKPPEEEESPSADGRERVRLSDTAFFSVDPDRFLMRYYNNHINDPCVSGTAPFDNTPCPATDFAHDVAEVVPMGPWFRKTAAVEQALLCPPGMRATDALGVACEACPAGYTSSSTQATSCSACPASTFADAASALIPGGGRRSAGGAWRGRTLG